METGIELIAAERKRQIEGEGYTAEHDDEHAPGNLPMAAAAYALREPVLGEHILWPWDRESWKPGEGIEGRIRDHVKAGAVRAPLERSVRFISGRVA